MKIIFESEKEYKEHVEAMCPKDVGLRNKNQFRKCVLMGMTCEECWKEAIEEAKTQGIEVEVNEK